MTSTRRDSCRLSPPPPDVPRASNQRGTSPTSRTIFPRRAIIRNGAAQLKEYATIKNEKIGPQIGPGWIGGSPSSNNGEEAAPTVGTLPLHVYGEVGTIFLQITINQGLGIAAASTIAIEQNWLMPRPKTHNNQPLGVRWPKRTTRPASSMRWARRPRRIWLEMRGVTFVTTSSRAKLINSQKQKIKSYNNQPVGDRWQKGTTRLANSMHWRRRPWRIRPESKGATFVMDSSCRRNYLIRKNKNKNKNKTQQSTNRSAMATADDAPFCIRRKRRKGYN